jgi:hypothetical protein
MQPTLVALWALVQFKSVCNFMEVSESFTAELSHPSLRLNLAVIGSDFLLN